MRNVGIVHLERKKHQKFKLPMRKNRSADKRVYPASKDRFKKELVLLRVYGYVRVSTKGQAPGTSLDEQTAEILEKYPTAVIVREVASGASERPEFVKICEQLESGDYCIRHQIFPAHCPLVSAQKIKARQHTGVLL